MLREERRFAEDWDHGNSAQASGRGPVRLVVHRGQVRLADGLLLAAIEGQLVVLGWLPRPPLVRPPRLPVHASGPLAQWHGEVVVTSPRIAIQDDVLHVECTACGGLEPLHRVGLRNIGGHVRNQPRCSACRGAY